MKIFLRWTLKFRVFFIILTVVEDEKDVKPKKPEKKELEDIVKEKKAPSFFAEAPEPTNEIRGFNDLAISRPIIRALADLGFVKPTPIQSRAIPLALKGLDICGAAVTGSGKTAAFLIPILERLLYRPRSAPASRVLILVPTRELAVQCHKVALDLSKYMDVQFCLCIGGTSLREQEATLRQRPDIIIATPGRLVDHMKNTSSMSVDALEILIIDEADRILEEGFADELKEIIKFCPKGRQTLLFSATMTDKVEDLANLSLNKPVRLFVDSNMTLNARVSQEFVRVRAEHIISKPAILLALCSRNYKKDVIVFFKCKKTAHELTIFFDLCGLRVAELHGNLNQRQRMDALEKFKNKQVDYLFCTDVLSRGIDIQGVQTVINYDMPIAYQPYVHRIGRTARGTSSGCAVSLVTEDDRKLMKTIIKISNAPIKNRIIPVPVIEEYTEKFKSMAVDIKARLEEDRTAKMIEDSERQIQKTENMIKYADEIKQRPKRQWIKTSQEGKKKQKVQK
jgi:ATP-dependent RNA helicase DDX27